MNAIQTELLSARATKQVAVRDPATQQNIGSVPSLTAEQIAASVARSRATQQSWAATPVAGRLRIVRRFQQLLADSERGDLGSHYA